MARLGIRGQLGCSAVNSHWPSSAYAAGQALQTEQTRIWSRGAFSYVRRGDPARAVSQGQSLMHRLGVGSLTALSHPGTPAGPAGAA